MTDFSNTPYVQSLAALKTGPVHKLKEIGDQWRTPDPLFWGINAMFGPLVLYPPNRARRDLDNCFKALFDALTHAGIWQDNSQVKQLSARWGEVTIGGKAEITIREIRL